MATVLLIIIYIAFISLGLPDAVLGAAWPVMQADLGAPLEAAGYLFSTISIGTIISSLVSGRMLNRFGTGRVTVVSVLMTATALLGFWFAPSVGWLFLFTVPLGLGAGAVDAGLNDYVAVNYKAHHMNWLHSFWGVGATLGPIVIARFLAQGNSWRDGYWVIALFQFGLTIVLVASLPLWKKVSERNGTDEVEENSSETNQHTISRRVKGVGWSLLAFVFYSGVEQTVNLWGSTYLVDSKGIDPVTAARWVSIYFVGITIGRLLSGFVSFKMSTKQMIYIGQVTALVGAFLLVLPLPEIVSLVGFVVIGLGLAPIFPGMLHETPARFGKNQSQRIMGLQMAVGYTGTTILPPLFGFIASQTTTAIFPFFLVFYAGMMLFSTVRLNQVVETQREVRAQEARSFD